MSQYATRNKSNIDIVIQIGDYKLQMSIPKQTKINSLITIVKNYEKLHQLYGPMDSYFVGLCTKNGNPVIDYWLTQSQLDFSTFKKKLQLKALYSIQRCIQKLSISQFHFLKCLGKGACGQVYLVRNKITGYLFALKRLRKQNINDYKAWQSLIRQKKILSLLPPNSHTVNFHGSFQSEKHFNFLMDYYPGGQLFIHLSSQTNKLTEKQAKVYFCQILLAMQYLHKQKILYRDLKPQNVLVDIQGHLRITDFGLSKCGFQQEDIALSQCGSQEYMAPQILQNKNYNFSADFYSIGAILYELLTGLPPYYEQQNSIDKLSQMKCMDLDIQRFQSYSLRDLLRNLLNPLPQMRLCNYQEIKNNQWLSEINWKQIEGKKNCLKFAPNIYKNYIGQEFLQLQEEVEEINNEQTTDFEPLFEGLFNFVKQTSHGLVLGFRQSNISKNSSNSLRQVRQQTKDNMSQKRKTACFVKQKQKVVLKHKQNFSIQLFEKQDSTNSSHTSSTQNSNSSNIPYNPKTTRNMQSKNKQNVVLFKKASTKKLAIINDTLSKITRQPSEKKLTKNPSEHMLLTKQPTQKTIIKQSNTPRRLNTNCNSSIDQPMQFKIGEKKQQGRQNHFISKSKDNKQMVSKIAIKKKQHNSSLMKSNNASTFNIKNKAKSKSKSKQKLQLKPRTKESFGSIGPSQKAKLPSCTYKIKLM